MTQASIPTVKTKFETGDRPSQQDYIDLIDTTSSQATNLGSFGNNENAIYNIQNATVIDSFDATVWRMVKYLISISKTSNQDNKFYATEITILVDGEDVNVSEYGTIDNSGNIGDINLSKTGNTVAITVTPIVGLTPITVRYSRIGLKA